MTIELEGAPAWTSRGEGTEGLHEAIAMCETDEAAQTDLRVQLDNTRMTSKSVLSVFATDGRVQMALRLREDGAQSLLGLVGIPWAFAMKLNAHAVADIYNAVVRDGVTDAYRARIDPRRSPGSWRSKRRVFRTERGVLAAVVSERYAAIKHSAVLKRLSNGLAPSLWGKTITTRRAGNLKCNVLSTRTVEPRVGDVSQLGVNMTHGTTGKRALNFGAFAFRLVCSNGAVVRDREFGSYSARHIGTPHRLWRGFSNAVYKAGEGMDAMATMIEASAMADGHALVPIATRHVRALVGKVRADEFGVELADSNGGLSAYDVVNAVTALANHEDFAHREGVQDDLQAYGGYLLQAHAHIA